ncbi:MAG: PDZ domain-containing protein [Nitrospirota bacterium]
MILPIRISLLLSLAFCWSCASYMTPAGQTYNNDQSYCKILHLPNDIKEQSSPRPFLGISMKPATQEASGLEGCRKFIQVADVIEGSPAMNGGIKENDIILTMNGMPACTGGESGDILSFFKKMVEREGIEEPVKLVVMRDGHKMDITVRSINRFIRRKPEAFHQTGLCKDGPSMLEEKLMSENRLGLFQSLTEGLETQSNLVHNPEWLSKNISNPYQLNEFTYMLRHPLMSVTVADELTGKIIDATSGNGINLSEVFKASALLLDIDYASSGCSGLTLPGLISRMEETYKRINEVFQALSQDEKEFFLESALEPWNSDKWSRLLELSLRIDLRGLLNSFSPLISCLNNSAIADLKRDLLERFKDNDSPILFEKEASFGKVIVGGMGQNVYTDDAALILDIGGNDIYLNNAGGTRKGMPIALVIDWEGDDIYFSKEPFSQGSGVLGGGFLIDLKGDDTFTATDGSQGTGIFGTGMLFHGEGSGVFRSKSFSQGTGQFGIGILWSRDKDTVYECGRYGQALGLSRGAGILIDDNGNDRYMLGGVEPDFRDPLRSTVSMGQGFGKGIRPEKKVMGVSGGIGMLIDKNGDDTYIADYFAQGASYYYGVGILKDLAGNDRYISGRYAQGAGIHSSIGILIDESGDDFYYSSYGVAQGIGHDFGVGVLDDRKGNDRYISGILSQGAATTGGLGLLLDRAGSDSYSIKANGQAYAHDEACAGIVIDLETSGDYVSSHKDKMPVRANLR